MQVNARKRGWIARAAGALSVARQASATTAALRATVAEFRRPTRSRSHDEHLTAAVAWLCRAQDACSDGGVSYGYDLRDGRWLPAYPETTGYIIPSLLEYSARPECPQVTREELRRRSTALARWLTTIQMESGAIPCGTVATHPKVATVFNTGQVLEGWCRAWSEAPDPAIGNAIERAARWLISVQDSDGCWRKGLSPLTPDTPATYNVRTAAALHDAGVLLAERAWREAASRNANWVLTQQRTNGWFAHNCVSDHERPLTHAIGYTLEGLLRLGAATRNERYVAAVETATRRLTEGVEADGFLSGRFDDEWRPVASWNCLTGASQLSLVWFRLASATGEAAYARTARSVLDFVCRTQIETGGIKGSYPVWGSYEPYRLPNWAAKFFADALMACPDGMTA